MVLRSKARRILIIAFLAVILVRVWPHASLASRFPLSTEVWSADGELLRATLASDGQYRLWTAFEDISPDLVNAFLLKEDRWFYWHLGVNPAALVRAGVATARGHGRQGGSTLTMQLARLAYRLNTRTLAGKMRQMVLAIWIEARYSKREILEAYLNVTPFGGNIQGVGAASRVYLEKAPLRVTIAEALTLAVIPQRPQARVGAEGELGLLEARSRLGRQWLARYGASDADRRQIELPVVARRRESLFALPHEAPHFVDAALSPRFARAGKVETTLDLSLQRLVERQIALYIAQHGGEGIRNAAALLVDWRDAAVKAWVGSAGYWNAEIHGQVNGVLARRSPGSTLKPFVYALGLDQGALHPRTILRDAPAAFGPFSPENFDGDFFGPIPAEEALIRSRNVPAVFVSSQLRRPNLYEFLRSAGISRLKPESHYGLALTLGGGEVTMEELTGLYAMLAYGGTQRPLRIVQSAPAVTGTPVLSPEASFITLDMLRRNPRPDGAGTLPLRSEWPVAWKTGTSWGFRDAWTAGIAGPYALTVWIGDFEGQGNPRFVGAEAAAPLFFRIVDAIQLARPDEQTRLAPPPPGVEKVAVCAASGELPNALCPVTVDTWYIPGKSPIRVSRLHRAVAVDARSGRPVCPPYPDTTRFDVYEFWSSDMLRLFREAGVPRRSPPQLPACAAEDSGEGPRIASPLRNVEYTLRRSRPDQTIPLQAHVAADVRYVFWFDGNALIARLPAAQEPLAWRPSREGAHLIRIVDDHGRSAERDVQARFVP